MPLRVYLKLIVLTIFIFSAFGAVYLFAPTVSQKEGVVYYLRPGLSKRSVITALYQMGVIKHPVFFSIYAFFTPQSKIKAGEYVFVHGRNFVGIWHQITTGTGFYYHPFTLVPGWTYKQFDTALHNDPWLKKKTESLAPLNSSHEGMLFPDTYFFTRGEYDTDILKHAAKLMQKKLMDAYNKRNDNLPYQTPYETLIVASMIEKEAYLDVERPMIASVIINRLKKGIPLQIDATIIYALGDQYNGTIYKKDLQIVSPYNTYLNKGLPPTPIAFPSLASINAACHPAVSDYYYYVAKRDGSHQFSKTLEEHEKAISEIKLRALENSK